MKGTRQGSLCIGVMSGTSVDGIDIAITAITGETPHLSVDLIYFKSIPFSSIVKEAVFRLFQPHTSSSEDLCSMNFLLGELFAEAIVQVAEEANIDLQDVLLISSHGQTIFHNPKPQLICGRMVSSTLQIGESAIIAERTGCLVVSDFRVRDMAAGGQGAPLVPFVDSLLFFSNEGGRVAVNIGGIANVTYVPQSGSGKEIIAFDTGPGNMIIDGLVRLVTKGQQQYDSDGEIAKRGTIQEDYLQRWMMQPYISEQPPKSTGRELFGEQCVSQWWKDSQQYGMNDADLIATATAYTVRTLAQAIKRFILQKHDVVEALIGGGGAYNPIIMEGIRRELPELRILSQDKTGITSESKEAVAFAVLGYECFHRRPNNVPSATGARHPVVMGKITYP